MVISNLLIPIHCFHIEIFLEEVDILTSYTNITFEEYNKVFQYDLKDVSKDLDIN